MNVQEIPVENIVEISRLRDVDRDVVEGLAASIYANGLQQPIQVRKQPLTKDKFILISGAHRLAACRELEMETVPCVVAECSDLEARLMEVDENLIRYELTPFDRAAFLAERKKIYEEMHPQTKAGVAGANAKHCGSENIDKTGGSANAIVAFAEITAEKLKLSRRTVESALRMHRDLSPESKTAIAGTWLARSGKDLELLSRQSPETQERVLRLIDSVPDMARPGGVAMALNRTQGKSEPASGATKTIREFDALLKIWAATHAPARQLFIEHLKEKEGVCDKKKDDEVQ